MRCLKKRTLRQYIDNEFSQKRKNKIEVHLANCAKCAGKVETLKERSGFIRGKIENLGPTSIPERDFVYPQKTRRRSAPSFIRLPVPVFSLMIGIIFIMAAGLFLQGQKISRMKAPGLIAAEKSAYDIAPRDNYNNIFIKLDLEDYRPVKNPKITILKEVKNENKNI